MARFELWLLLAGLLTGAPSFHAVAQSRETVPSRNAPVIRPPDIVLDTYFPTMDGGKRRLRDGLGKVLIVNIWATWCGPCRQEIPYLIELASEYRRQGVEVIGLTTEHPVEDLKRVREFARQLRIDYPVGFAGGEFARYLMQGRGSIPQAYVLGRDGRVIRHFVGFNPRLSPPQLRAAVEAALRD